MITSIIFVIKFTFYLTLYSKTVPTHRYEIYNKNKDLCFPVT